MFPAVPKKFHSMPYDYVLFPVGNVYLLLLIAVYYPYLLPFPELRVAVRKCG